MKLIVAGSTGYVATEVIRQALAHPSITSVISLGRREAPVPATSDAAAAAAAKLKSVICTDFENYSDDVKKELSGADACIWTIGITPSKTRSYTWDQLVKICRDYSVTGIQTISQLERSKPNNPLRFVYVSAVGVSRDPAASKPWIMGDFLALKGETESRILEYAQKSNGGVEACIAKPGLIGGQGAIRGAWLGLMKTVFRAVSGKLPVVEVEEVAAALLEGVVSGFEGRVDLFNEDLARIGRGVLDGRVEKMLVKDAGGAVKGGND